jgi:hypothetical protein
MRIFGRIFIIFVAALVVAAATIALVGNNTGSFEAEAERAPVFQEQPASSEQGEANPGRPPREGHDAPSFFGIIGIFQNLVIISGIVLLVTLAGRARRTLARFGAWRHNS